MLKSLKVSFTAVLLGSVAAVPAASVALISTTGAVHAKSGDSNGGKGGNSSHQSNGKSANIGHAGGNGKSQKGGLGKGLNKFFASITGEDGTSSGTVKKGKLINGMHPSDLGNMNGAYHANINAVLAHIRNGNTNGPVGLMAELAVADHSAQGAQQIIDLVGALDAAGYATVQDYFAALQGTPGNGSIDEIESAIAGGDQTTIDLALQNNGFASLGDYIVYRDGTPGVPNDPALDDAVAALGGDASTYTDTSVVVDEQAIADANTALGKKSGAEGDILAYWNKNGDTDPSVVSPDEQSLLDTLYSRFDGNEAAIGDAIATTDTTSAAASCDTSTDPGCSTSTE